MKFRSDEYKECSLGLFDRKNILLVLLVQLMGNVWDSRDQLAKTFYNRNKSNSSPDNFVYFMNVTSPHRLIPSTDRAW